MSRKDFENIAHAIKVTDLTPEAREDLIRNLIPALRGANPRFAEDRFRAAATPED